MDREPSESVSSVSGETKQVNTNDIIEVADQNNIENNKYKINTNFNHDVYTASKDEDNEASGGPSWMPSILKDHSWPDSTGNSQSVGDAADGNASVNQDQAVKVDLNNPLLSLKDTVLWNQDSHARNDADWKKYQALEFELNNKRLKNLPNTQSSIPNTFANKFNKKHGNINRKNNNDNDLADGHMESPFKLFDVEQDTYTKLKMNNILSNLSPQKQHSENVPNVIKESDELYNKIVTGGSGDGSVLKKTVNASYYDRLRDDITSDAEEFSSFPSTARKMMYQGDKLFKNIQEGYEKLPPISTQSDYTSTEEREDSSRGVDYPHNNNSYINKKNSEVEEGNDVDSDVDKLREHLSTQAEAFNAEFQVSSPKLQDKFILESNEAPHKGLHFIPADEYKNKVYDKRLKRFVSQSQLADSSYTDTELGYLDNLSTSDIDATSHSVRRTPREDSKDNTPRHDASENDTLDETQFSVSDKHLVEVISQSFPIEDWGSIEELDISGYDLKQLQNLDKMTPNIWYLDASNNLVNQNFGIPNSVQYLNLCNNKFNNLSSKFYQFTNLQILDLSGNELTDLRCLQDLKNLTSLNLKGNKLKDVEHLSNFKMLHYLNLSDNRLRATIDFRGYTMWFLEDLILDNNEIEKLVNISELPKLINLSANNNQLNKIVYHIDDEGEPVNESVSAHPTLKRICLNNNCFARSIDFSMYPQLKELQVDGIKVDVHGLSMNIVKLTHRYTRDNNESLLKYSSAGNNLHSLYLTGGKLPALPICKNKFSSVSVLDISAMNITVLPDNFSEFFPLLVDLNLNFNKLQTLNGLQGLRHLKMLKLLSNNIQNLQDVIDYTNGIRMSLKLIDLRVNPISQDFYPFIFYNERDGGEYTPMGDLATFQLKDRDDIDAFAVEYTRLYSPTGLEEWVMKNRKHMKRLPPKVRLARSEYTALLCAWFESILYIDGLLIDEMDKRALINSLVEV